MTKKTKKDKDIHPALFLLLVIILVIFSLAVLYYGGK